MGDRLAVTSGGLAAGVAGVLFQQHTVNYTSGMVKYIREDLLNLAKLAFHHVTAPAHAERKATRTA